MSQTRAPGRKTRFGVVGAGLWGSFHCQTLNAIEASELYAVCDLNPERAAEMQRQFGATKVYTDYRDLLANPDVEAVTVATPDFAHGDIVLAAIKAGKHVMSEKPLATTLAEVEAIASAAAVSGTKTMVDFHNRVSPPIVAVKQAVAAGEIGVPLHASARLSNTQFVPFELLSWAAKSSALWFLGSHALDALRFIMGAEVKRVQAMARHGHLAGKGVDTADVHMALLEFDNGCVATLQNSWVLPLDLPSIVDFRIDIVGEKGAVETYPTMNDVVKKYTGNGLRGADVIGITPTAGGRIGGFVTEAIARFVDAVVLDAPVLADARDGLQVTRVLVAIEESARTGKTITLADGVA
ncbi:putative dehydrogenase [Kaistia hirudinis]|uniref:Putative dehydrogenase n=1 Tax=Kaistia hirudinis TaxID=1293440 RepID=A0A840AM79_9HYPH|nr:Gfo/Idh/MocA family oxidoreductase [Kaistia hirudinis]MBB3930374.1 putative dehydrogenase [Kaistia hirudinis]